jgi:hypothetical protein
MSALGQKQTSDWCPLMSALPAKADMRDEIDMVVERLTDLFAKAE